MRKNREERTKLVGLVEVSLGAGKIATALLFDNMRWVLAVSAPSIPYEIGSTATFIEEDDDLAIERAEHMVSVNHSSKN